MNDYTELKRLAEAAVGKTYSSGEKFFFSAEATPEQVLALIAENDSSRKHWQNESNNVQALMVEVVRLKADNEALRNAALSKAVVWCACGDGHPANSYGAGFMDANGGVCANCDAAVGSGLPDSRGSEQGQTPTETPVPERSACRSENQ